MKELPIAAGLSFAPFIAFGIRSRRIGVFPTGSERTKPGPPKLRTVSAVRSPIKLKHPLSDAQQTLYCRLVTALPHHFVLAQVRASRFIGDKLPHRFSVVHRRRMSHLRYDFVVCARDARVVAAIVLDERRHDNNRSVESEDAKAIAADEGGLRLLRWTVSCLPSQELIKREVLALDKFKGPTAATLT